MMTGICYWRFRGDKSYRFGFVSHVKGNLYRMGLYNGDYAGGFIVDFRDVEVQ